MAEIVEKNGKKFVRINPDDIDVSKMTPVQKVGDVVAAQVTKGRVKVVTKHNKEIETINYAGPNDWFVYDIGPSTKTRVVDILLSSEKRAISKKDFSFLYQQIEGSLAISTEEVLQLAQELILDNHDNPEFKDSSFLYGLKKYRYVGRSVFAAKVPFNFVIRAPWGEDQLIEKGGIIIYDTNTSQAKRRDIYAIEGAHNRMPGEFEKKYMLANNYTASKDAFTKPANVVSDNSGNTIADTFQMVIKADRSPIAGVQFSNIDLAKAYDKAGKTLPNWLNKFLPD